MKLLNYLKDKLLLIIISVFFLVVISMLEIAFKSPKELVLATIILLITYIIISLLLEYFRKKSFYNELINNTNKLDKKYLVLETLTKPNFYEGKILSDILYEIDKSMLENVNSYLKNINEFKDYIEMWIHEVKIPISSLTLMFHNDAKNIDKKYVHQVRKLDNYIDQVVYYTRIENAEKDYLIKETELSKIISRVALKNKDDLLENKISFEVDNISVKVLTDGKWLEFIVNQIINNSIKYKNDKDAVIKIYVEKNSFETTLNIYDNGIGIPERDIKKVFLKSFTGENGRTRTKSTGIGLYICKKLCNKLGHKIEITSKQKEYTLVSITFSNNNFYKINN